MILTVTLNPALDLTYRVDALVRHGTHRVRTVAQRAGGKGLNVARTLHSLGEPVLATGLLGGPTGARVGALLTLPADFVQIAAETRRTVAVVDDLDATGFWEPGPQVTAAEWSAFRTRYEALSGRADVVVLSGSLPGGLPVDAYATLIRIAREHQVPTVLDTSGEPLRHGVTAGPDLVKPNLDELAGLLGAAVEPIPRRAARVRELGAAAVVVSTGREGLVAVTPAGAWRAAPPEVVAGNPTGAGDACVAALARGLRDRTPWPERLADAVALSAAAAGADVAGALDVDLARSLRPRVAIIPTH